VFIALILAHIYLGSIGMEGAFDAMGKGEVEEQWAREHHGLWVKELEAKAAKSGATAPAE
jgi:formate dehydrogenase subunit gamma